MDKECIKIRVNNVQMHFIVNVVNKKRGIIKKKKI